MIRLIAVDIDGTITYMDRRLDPMAVEALRKAEAAGIKVTLATGNVLSFAEAASVMVGTSGPLMAEDGGVLFDQANRVETVLGDRKEADRCLTILQGIFGPLRQTRSSAQRLTGVTLEREVSIEEVRRIISREALDLVAVDSGFAIHLRDPRVNKGRGLEEISKMTRIPLKDIAAIGDGPNDVEMLGAAGLSFAVANSPEEVRKASTSVTKSPFGKGVAEAVDAILASRALT